MRDTTVTPLAPYSLIEDHCYWQNLNMDSRGKRLSEHCLISPSPTSEFLVILIILIHINISTHSFDHPPISSIQCPHLSIIDS